MSDVSSAAQASNDLPAALPFPFPLNVRNADLGIDDAGKLSRLDETRAVMMLHRQIPPGTVMFASMDIRTLNTSVRGLIRVISQTQSGDGLAFDTLTEFVELSDESKKKIEKLLGKTDTHSTFAPARNFATDQLGVQPVYQRGAPTHADYQVASTERTYFEPAPLRQQAKATGSTKFWNSLGVTAYVAAALIVIAFFPAGRAIELLVWDKVTWSLERMWYWANHVGQVKLYNNT